MQNENRLNFYHCQKQHDAKILNIMTYVIEAGIYYTCDIDLCYHASRHYLIETNHHIIDNVDSNILSISLLISGR